MPQLYLVTREFTGGVLKGLTYSAETTVPMPVGKQVTSPCGGSSPYKIIACEPVEAQAQEVSQ